MRDWIHRSFFIIRIITDGIALRPRPPNTPNPRVRKDTLDARRSTASTPGFVTVAFHLNAKVLDKKHDTYQNQ